MFQTLQYFVAPGSLPEPKFINPDSKALSINLPNLIPLYDNLSTKYLVPNFVDFVESVTFRLTKTISPHTLRRH